MNSMKFMYIKVKQKSGTELLSEFFNFSDFFSEKYRNSYPFVLSYF